MERPALVRALLDPTLRAIASIYLVVGALHFLAPISTGLAWYLGAPLLLVLAVAAIQYRLRGAEGESGRLFWHYVCAALALWLAAFSLEKMLPQLHRETTGTLLVDCLYASYYLALIFATEIRPDLGAAVQPREREEELHLGSTVSFLLALVIYCAVIPSQRDPETYLTGYFSVLLFLCLDFFFLARFGYLAGSARDARWRLVYLSFLVTFALSAAFGLRALAVPGGAAEMNAKWGWLPFLPILVAARASRYMKPAPAAVEHYASRVWEPLAFHAIAFPFLHLVLDFYGKLSAPSRTVQQGLVIIYFVFFGSISLVHSAWQEKKRRGAEQALRDSERLASLGQFSAAMAHKIRNPLAAIVMQTFFLQDRMKEDREVERSLADINAAAERMQKLVEGILAFVRPATLHLADEDLIAVVDSARRDLARRGEITQTAFAEDYRHREAVVAADANQLVGALTHILDNAARAMPDDGVVRIATDHPTGASIRLVVEDAGSGIREDDLERIFEPFFTRRGDGVGLGLTLVARVLEAHSCDYRVESRSGEGTRFILTFQLAQPLAAAG